MVRPMNRRTLLRGAGGAAVALPFLEAMMPRRAHAGGGRDTPLRLLVFFSNNGTYHPNYYPVGSEHDFQLSPILEPLSPFQDRLIVTSGIDMESSYHGYDPGGPHHWIGNILSGALVQQNPATGWAIGGGITLDQYLGQQIGRETRFPTFEFGVKSQQYSGNAEAHLSYSGPAMPISREDDPLEVFDRIFGDFDEDPAELAARRAKSLLVVDAVNEDMQRLRAKLGAADRMRLDEHIESIAQIETQLQSDFGGLGAACSIPNIGDPLGGQSPYTNDLYPALGQSMMDMLVMTLACDQTRVTTLQWNEALGTLTFDWLGHDEDWHEISHKGDGDMLGNQQKTEVNRWYAEQLAYLAGQLDAVPEGDGTLLDNTLIIWVNELARGNAHNRRDMPFVIMGDAQGYFETGRWLQYGGAYHNDLLVSIANAMGVGIDTFGEAAYCTGPLAGLTG